MKSELRMFFKILEILNVLQKEENIFCYICQSFASLFLSTWHVCLTMSPKESSVYVLSKKNTTAAQPCRPSWSPSFSSHISLTGRRSEKKVTSLAKSQRASMDQECCGIEAVV